jgi:hydrogenase nickel incorporation protein HypA/HybF
LANSKGTIVDKTIVGCSNTHTEIMHELSIARSIVEIVEQTVSPADYSAVTDVHVRIGEMAGVVPDSLAFCFSAVVAETPLCNAKLTIEHVPLTMECKTCGNKFRSEFGYVPCPRCKQTDTTVLSGTELQVVEIELADSLESI